MFTKSKRFLSLILVVSISACSETTLFPVQSSKNILSQEDIKNLDNEYNFSTKALTRLYLFKKLNKWINENNGDKLVKEIEYARLKGESVIPFSSAINSQTDLCGLINSNSSILSEKSNNSNLNNFLDNKCSFFNDLLGEIAYITSPTSSETNYHNLSIMKADGGNNTNLSNYYGFDANPKISPDGAKILFHSESENVGNSEIYSVNVDGSNRVNLSNNTSYDVEGTWSPDGSKIVFRSSRDGRDQIYMMNIDGSNQTNISNNSSSDVNPVLSPDGAKIAFTSDRDGRNQIYIMNVDGSNQTNISSSSYNDTNPVFSPDGTKIAFTSYQDGRNQIYIINVDGNNKINLSNSSSDEHGPAFSPDSNKIIYSTNISGTSRNIYKMDLDGNNKVNLTNYNANEFAYSPIFSPNGNKIAFLYYIDPNLPVGADIYVMNSDGSNQINLTNTPSSDDHSINWSN